MQETTEKRFSSGLLNYQAIDSFEKMTPEAVQQLQEKHGTTIVAAYYENGSKIIMASDRKTSLGGSGGVAYNWALDTVKARLIDDKTCYGGAGLADPIHLFGQIVTAAAENYKEDYGYSITSFGITGWVKSLSTRLSIRFGSVSQFIVSGINPRPAIFHISGSMVYEMQSFTVIGSGTRTLRPLVAKSWRKDIGEEEIISLLLDSFMHTRREDPGSGWDEFNAPNIYLLRDIAEEIPGKTVFRMLRDRQEKFIEIMGEGGMVA